MSFKCFKVTYEVVNSPISRDTYCKFLEPYENDNGAIFADEELRDEVLDKASFDKKAFEELLDWFNSIELFEEYLFE